MSHEPGTTIKPLVRLGKSPADCWEWLGHINENGCACKQFSGKKLVARRWMWMQLFGPIPDSIVITTTCNNGACVNPHHLFATDQTGATRNGIGSHLLPQDVIEIRRAKKTKGRYTASHLAEKHGVSPTTIRDIWNGKSWKQKSNRVTAHSPSPAQ